MLMLTKTPQLTPLFPLLDKIMGKRPSPATVWRWCNTGIKVGDRRVKLRAIRIGCKLYATSEDVERWIAAQNPPDEPDDPQDDRDAATERRLAAAGLL